MSLSRTLIFGALGVFGIFGIIGPASAGCTMYEHINYGGNTFYIAEQQSYTYLGNAWNDRVSSVQVSDRCQLITYQHINYGGDRRTYDSSVSFVGNLWNDQISSAQCMCSRRTEDRQCVLYQHRDFSGQPYGVAANTQTEYVGDRFNDQASSVSVPFGCELHVYQHRDFGGDSRTFRSGNNEYFGDLWNDRVSSARCVCARR